MNTYQSIIQFNTQGKGMLPITRQLDDEVNKLGIRNGICHLFIQHTSASLVISESYDPTAREDMEGFMDRIAPERQPWYAHTMEGADDSPSHLRAMLTDTSLSIPIIDGRLGLGTWQGVYLFEHRRRGHTRKIIMTCMGE